jgi:hypothetical protein
MNEKENENVTRRKFLEDSSKKALVGSAAAFLGLVMIKPKDAQAATCSGACTNDCTTSCSTDCKLSCSVDCYGICKDDCQGNCNGDCAGPCTNSCWAECSSMNSPSGAPAAEVKLGTPVSEREVSTRHVTV